MGSHSCRTVRASSQSSSFDLHAHAHGLDLNGGGNRLRTAAHRGRARDSCGRPLPNQSWTPAPGSQDTREAAERPAFRPCRDRQHARRHGRTGRTCLSASPAARARCAGGPDSWNDQRQPPTLQRRSGGPEPFRRREATARLPRHDIAARALLLTDRSHVRWQPRTRGGGTEPPWESRNGDSDGHGLFI